MYFSLVDVTSVAHLILLDVITRIIFGTVYGKKTHVVVAVRRNILRLLAVTYSYTSSLM